MLLTVEIELGSITHVQILIGIWGRRSRLRVERFILLGHIVKLVLDDKRCFASFRCDIAMALQAIIG